MRYFYTYAVALIFFGIPQSIYAATLPSNDFKGLVAHIVNFINILIYFLFALALVVFLWGLINSWIIHGGEEEGVEKGKKYMEAGLIGFVILTSLWGIVYIFKNSLFGG